MISKVRIAITGARAPVAFHLARLLIDAGHSVTLVDHLKHPLAAASRLNIPYRQIPAFSEDPEAAGDALHDVIEKRGIDFVIPTCEEVLHLGALWSRKPPKATLFAPKLADLSQVHHKYHFIRLCEDLGISTPRTQLITTPQELATHVRDAQDLVFKPVWSRFGSQVLIQPKARKLQLVQPTLKTPWVAQEYVDGTEFCVYAIAHAGKLIALSAYRGLVRAGPGAAICFAPENSEPLRGFVEKIISATAWTGQISFDVMRTQDGRFLPLECNPRATSGLHFFSDGAAFSRAIFGQTDAVKPDVTAPQTLPLALWLYGLPMMLNRQQRLVFLDALRRSGDVMRWPSDRVGYGAQLRAVAEFAGIAFRHRISLERASTWGIEWNGEDQSAIS
ncbi:MAG: ATP-grasp domain-containing protein [Roseobacter sp.]